MLNGSGQLLTHLLTQRPLSRHYYQNTDVFIFMVDSNDRDRISESQDELQRAMEENELKDSILLVLANKQDLPNAMSVQEITEKLGLNNLKDRLWRKGLCISPRGKMDAVFIFGHYINNRHSKLMCHKWRWSVRRT